MKRFWDKSLVKLYALFFGPVLIIVGFVLIYRPDNWINYDKTPLHKIDKLVKNSRRSGIIFIVLGLFILIGGIYEIFQKR